jgi:hypothetical protein
MKGSEKQVRWAEDIKASFIQHNFTDSIEMWDGESEEMVSKIRAQQAEFEGAIAPYADNAKFWIDRVSSASPKMLIHEVRNYPDTLTRYL